MAVTIYDMKAETFVPLACSSRDGTLYEMNAETFVPLEFTSRIGVEWPSEDSRIWPYPIQGGVRALYNQRCVDTVTVTWTSWATYYQDIYGNEYPGAGFDSATYKIESIIYDREQG